MQNESGPKEYFHFCDQDVTWSFYSEAPKKSLFCDIKSLISNSRWNLNFSFYPVKLGNLLANIHNPIWPFWWKKYSDLEEQRCQICWCDKHVLVLFYINIFTTKSVFLVIFLNKRVLAASDNRRIFIFMWTAQYKFFSSMFHSIF